MAAIEGPFCFTWEKSAIFGDVLVLVHTMTDDEDSRGGHGRCPVAQANTEGQESANVSRNTCMELDLIC